MNPRKIGYTRVSPAGQPDRQLAGLELDAKFSDVALGDLSDRPGLDALLAMIGEGDTVIVQSVDRLSRDLHDVMEVVRKIEAAGATLAFPDGTAIDIPQHWKGALQR